MDFEIRAGPHAFQVLSTFPIELQITPPVNETIHSSSVVFCIDCFQSTAFLIPSLLFSAPAYQYNRGRTWEPDRELNLAAAPWAGNE